MRLLLDTHALVWYLEAAPLAKEALYKIAEAQDADTLYASPITAWEIALAAQKPNHGRRPNLLGQDPATWFRNGCRSVGAKIAPIKQKISFEAAALPQLMGNRDPGDCFIVATARVAKLAIVTRDSLIHEFVSRHPAYVQLVHC